MPNKGKLIDHETRLLVTPAGTKTAEYSMWRRLPDDAPVVRCEKTGRRFLLPWSDIIALAVEAGMTTGGAK